MDNKVKDYIDKYPDEIIYMYNDLRNLIFDSVSSKIEEILWAGLPSYYVGKSFLRLIPFKDHINIEAKSVIKYKDYLLDYKISPKGMLQIYLGDEIPFKILKNIVVETLCEDSIIV